MALGDSDLAEGAIVPVVSQAEGGDARGVGLKHHDHQVEHDVVIFRLIGRDTLRGFGGRVRLGPAHLRCLNARLDLPHSNQVLIEFSLVASRQPRPEKAFEGQARVGFRRDGRRRRTPRDVVLIGAGIVRIAGRGFARVVTRQFQRGEPGRVAHLAGHQLIDGDAEVDVHGALIRPGPGKKNAVGAGVVQAAQHADDTPHLLQGLEGGTQLEIGTAAARPEVRLDGAVGKVNKGGAERRPGGSRREAAGCRRVRRERLRRQQRLKGRQYQAGPCAP